MVSGTKDNIKKKFCLDFRYSLQQYAGNHKYIIICLSLAWALHPNAILQQVKRQDEILDFLTSHLEYMYEGFRVSTTACLIIKQRTDFTCSN